MVGGTYRMIFFRVVYYLQLNKREREREKKARTSLEHCVLFSEICLSLNLKKIYIKQLFISYLPIYLFIIFIICQKGVVM